MFRFGRVVLLWSLVAVGLAACGGSGFDKAGGQRSSFVVLTLADGEYDFSNAQPFADAVRRLSGGRMVIRIESPWRRGDPRYEQALIKDVEAGRAQLGISASRAFDTVGIESFQALQAPFLIDNIRLERSVLAGDIPGKMLAGLRPAGLVGLAILPGALRRPLGIVRPLLSVSDYRGARIGIRSSLLTEETLHALGATSVVLLPDSNVSGLDGVEAHLDTLDSSYPIRGATVTGNIAFEPRPNVIFMNSRAFESLNSSKRAIIIRAADQARISAGVYEPDAGAAQDLCQRGIKIVAASTSDLAGLRAAVRPVYNALESNPQTRAFIDEIVAIRHAVGGSPDTVSCPSIKQASGNAQPGAELLGTWEVTFTLSEFNAAGAYPGEGSIHGNVGHFTLTFNHRHWLDVGPRDGPNTGPASGTYVLNGDQIIMDRSDHAYPGSDTEIWGPYTWSVYRDALTFKKAGSAQMPTSLVVKAWRRAQSGG